MIVFIVAVMVIIIAFVVIIVIVLSVFLLSFREKDSSLKLLDAARAPTVETFMECMDMVNALVPETFLAMMNIPFSRWTHHASLSNTVILDHVASHALQLTSDTLNERVRRIRGGRANSLHYFQP